MPAPVLHSMTQQQAKQKLRGLYDPISVDWDIAAADTTTVTLAPLRVGWTIFITFIGFSVTVDAAQSISFQDNSGTPVVAAKTKASPGLGLLAMYFGDDGTALPEGTQLDALISGAGLAGRVHIEGYYKPTAKNRTRV